MIDPALAKLSDAQRNELAYSTESLERYAKQNPGIIPLLFDSETGEVLVGVYVNSNLGQRVVRGSPKIHAGFWKPIQMLLTLLDTLGDKLKGTGGM